MSVKIIDRKIASFITNRDKLKVQAHTIAMLIFDHAQEHSDCTRAIKLVAALPNSWQPQMTAWFNAFSPVRVVLKNGKCELSAEYKKAIPANRPDFWDKEAADGTPFYELTNEPKAEKTYTFAELVKLVERLGAQINRKIDENKVKPEDVPSAKAIAERITGLHFDKVQPVNDENEEEATELKQVA